MGEHLAEGEIAHGGGVEDGIDLFAGETANLLAQLVDLFGSALGADVVEKIKHHLGLN